ncbi:MAG: hypothetical protein PVJ57_11840 [Phycisphaerae bacterium]
MTARITLGSLATMALLASAAAPAAAGDWGVRFSYHSGPRYRTVYQPAHRVYYPPMPRYRSVSVAYASSDAWCDPVVYDDPYDPYDGYVACAPVEPVAPVYYPTYAPTRTVYYNSYTPVRVYTRPRVVYRDYRPRTVHVSAGYYGGPRHYSTHRHYTSHRRHTSHRVTVHRSAPRVYVRPPTYHGYRPALRHHRGVGVNVHYRGDHGRRGSVRFSYRR